MVLLSKIELIGTTEKKFELKFAYLTILKEVESFLHYALS